MKYVLKIGKKTMNRYYKSFRVKDKMQMTYDNIFSRSKKCIFTEKMNIEKQLDYLKLKLMRTQKNPFSYQKR